MYFQDLVLTLQNYWNQQGCLLAFPYDLEKGAGTFNPATFLRSLGPEPFSVAYVEPCRRPADGRYGENPIRMQHYYQFQVLLKPCPNDILDLYLGSLKALDISSFDHDIRFVHDDWETAALGAWGLGWEVWCDGTEITQFTYFQQVAGIELKPISGEITYGLERLCMFLQGKDNVYDIEYNQHLNYGDIYHQNEVQFSKYNFEQSRLDFLLTRFNQHEEESLNLATKGLALPSLDQTIKASHCFNLLDARGAISVNERQGYVLRIRQLAKSTAESWLKNRKDLQYPLLMEEKKAPEKKVIMDFAEAMPWSGNEKAALLIELGVEEMPAKVFPSLRVELPRLFEKWISPYNLNCTQVQFYFTPRRIALVCGEMDTRQKDEILELKGPPLSVARDKQGQWTKAALSFCLKNSVGVEKLRVGEGDQSGYVVATVHRKGKTAFEILAEIIPSIFSSITWYKTMRWADGETPYFVRPVKWLVVVLGDKTVPASFAGCQSTDKSQGHRFSHPGEIQLNAENYLEKLRGAGVLADPEERKAAIILQLESLENKHGLKWRTDEVLLEHVNFLVESPHAVAGSFDETFLRLPEEVLISEMREHQKYFAFNDQKGMLTARFAAISNTLCADMEKVKRGYENVLVSRLKDAAFFLEKDRKLNLESHLPKLKQLTFEKTLGSMLEKSQRIEKLAAEICRMLNFNSASIATVKKIAQLCKADLATAMVFEFPELQGEIGAYYGRLEKLPEEVCTGIFEHYLPRNAGDSTPSSKEAAVVALADRLDSLSGFFTIGKIPTGSSDPYALRRACIGCIAILVDCRLTLDLRKVIDAALRGYPDSLAKNKIENLVEDLLQFFLQRFPKFFQEKSPLAMEGDLIQAVLHSSTPWHDISDLWTRMKAMSEFVKRPDFALVASTFKRVSRILETKSEGSVDGYLLTEKAELDLWKKLEEGDEAIHLALRSRDYLGALSRVAELKPRVDKLFDEVLLNHNDEAIRTNRHRLVRTVRDIVLRVADFSKVKSTA